MPGSAPRMTSNCPLIAFTEPSSGRRCSASTLWSADPSVASPWEILKQAPAHLDQRGGQHEDDDDGEQDAQEGQQVRGAHVAPNPSVSAFM